MDTYTKDDLLRERPLTARERRRISRTKLRLRFVCWLYRIAGRD